MLETINFQQLVEQVGQIVATLALTGAIGLAITPLVEYVKKIFRLNESGNVLLKRIIAGVFSVFGGILTVYLLGFFIVATLLNIVVTSFLVFFASFVFYMNHFKGSEVQKSIEG